VAVLRVDCRTLLLAPLLTCLACAATTPPPGTPPPGMLARLPVGSGPTLLAISPDGARVYAAANKTLSVIDTAANRVVATLPTDPYPTGIAVTPDGRRVFITSLFSVRLLVVDTATNTQTNSIDLTTERFRGGFGRMAVSPDGSTAYVVNYGNRVLAVVDTTSGAMDVLLMNMGARDIALTPDGRTAYAAGCWSFCTPGTMQIFDPVSKRFGDRFAVGPGPYRIALSPDGTTAYTANVTDSSLSVIDLATRTVTHTVRAPVGPTGLAVSRDGAHVYVVGQTGGDLAVIDAHSLAVRTIPIGNRPRDVVVSPDGARAYVSTSSDVVVLDLQAI